MRASRPSGMNRPPGPRWLPQPAYRGTYSGQTGPRMLHCFQPGPAEAPRSWAGQGSFLDMSSQFSPLTSSTQQGEWEAQAPEETHSWQECSRVLTENLHPAQQNGVLRETVNKQSELIKKLTHKSGMDRLALTAENDKMKPYISRMRSESEAIRKEHEQEMGRSKAYLKA